jgi:hypothetical protein
VVVGVTALVLAGIALPVLAGVRVGLNATSTLLLVLVVALGVLAVAVARRSSTESAAPAHCPRCNGLVSPHAPYCKHCGAHTHVE